MNRDTTRKCGVYMALLTIMTMTNSSSSLTSQAWDKFSLHARTRMKRDADE